MRECAGMSEACGLAGFERYGKASPETCQCAWWLVASHGAGFAEVREGAHPLVVPSRASCGALS